MPSVQAKIAPIDPISDPRIEHKFATLNGHRYHYLLGVPKNGQFKKTVFLIHGWPDLAIGWRYQIPALINLGCRVVVPDMMGYGDTGAPPTPPNPLRLYGYKRASEDIAALAAHLGLSKIVLGGHDWGGAVVWRCAAFYPDLVEYLFSVCTPYTPPDPVYHSTEELAKGPMPLIGYQLHLASGELEKVVTTKRDMSAFIRGIYGARTPKKEVIFSATKGIALDKMHELGEVRVMSDRELDYYATQYAKNGLQGPLNWYRTRKINFDEEQELLNKKTIKMPTLMLAASRDPVLKPYLVKGMHENVPQLTIREVDGTHWVLVEKPDECNDVLREWFENVVFGGKSKL